VVPLAGTRRRLGHRGCQVERDFVDDEADAARVERRDDRAHRREVELAEGPTPHDVDLGLAGAVDVGHLAKEASVAAADLRSDDLVPPRLAGRQLRLPVDRDLEVRVAEALRGRPIVDLLEAEPPAGAVLDGRGVGNRQRRGAALAMEDATDDEAVVRAIREDLDPNQAPQAMGAADPPDDDPRRLAQGDPLRGSRA
jgi:hypothetical protein